MDFGPQTWCFPMPVYIIGSYDENGTPDAMTAAWGGIHDTKQIGICLDVGHKTVPNILAKKAFTVSMGTAKTVTSCDYVGIVSANKDADKIKKSGFTPVKSETVDAPYFKELPMVLECKLVSFEEKSGYIVGDIINIRADDSILTDGKIDYAKLDPITYEPITHKYLRLGECVGNAFSDGRKLLENNPS